MNDTNISPERLDELIDALEGMSYDTIYIARLSAGIVDNAADALRHYKALREQCERQRKALVEIANWPDNYFDGIDAAKVAKKALMPPSSALEEAFAKEPERSIVEAALQRLGSDDSASDKP